MIRRRLVRAFYAAVIAISAAAWSGWFVDHGQASGEAEWNSRALVAVPSGGSMGGDSSGAGFNRTSNIGGSSSIKGSVFLNERAGRGASGETVSTKVQGDSATIAEGDKQLPASASEALLPTAQNAKPAFLVSGGLKTASREAASDASTEAAAAVKTVYLTFDDGPSKLTPQVLDILQGEGIKATFFVLGEHVNEHPELIRRMAEEGHTVGNHTYDHEYKELYGSFKEFGRQIVKTEEALQEAAGLRTRLVRAPGGTFGNFDQSYFDAMSQAGYKIFDWNVDSGDSVRIGVPASEITNNIHHSRLHDETIVLLHDSASHAESVKALPDIIRYYKEKGYRFAPLTESVRPVTFRVADKLKWSRAKATPEEEKAVASGLAAAGEGQVAFSGSPSGQAGSNAGGEAKQTDLVVQSGERTVVFKPGSYTAGQDDWEVPLRELFEGLGGTVRWHAGDRSADVTLPDGSSFRIAADESGHAHVRDGVMYISLVQMLKQIGTVKE